MPTPPPGWQPPDVSWLKGTYDALVGDMEDAAGALAKPGLSDEEKYRARRAYVRASASFLEALSYLFRQSTLSLYYEGSHDLTPQEVVCLIEESPRLTAMGEIESGVMYASPVKLFLFSLKSLNRALRNDYSILTNASGLRDLKALYDIRNRVTHPRTLEDLLVSDADMRTAQRGMAWSGEVTNLAMARLFVRLAEKDGWEPPQKDASPS